MTASLTAFLVYTALVFGIGLWAARLPTRTYEDLHLGGRKHGYWTSALSASASTESGFVLLGMVGMGYSVGANALWIVPAGVGGYALMWLLLGPALRRKSASLPALTIPELISRSTGNTTTSHIASGLASVFAIVFLVAYVAAQFNAAGKALSVQFSISFFLGVMIGTGIVSVYALLGGFRAVSWTDNLQAIMMAFALILLPAVVIAHAGGPSHILSTLSTIDPRLVSMTYGESGSGAFMAIAPWLMLGLAYPGQPHAVARLMATRDAKIMGPAFAIAVTWFVLIYAGAVLLGMAARAGFSEIATIAQDPERTLPVLALEFLPGLIGGIVVASIMAAICSTADSTLVGAATTAARDLKNLLVRLLHLAPIPPFAEEDPRREQLLMRIAILSLSAIAAALALSDSTGDVFGLVLYAWSGLGASLGPTTIYCALSKDPRPAPALLGLVVGGAGVLLLHSHALNLLLGFCASGIALLLSDFVVRKMART